MEMGSDFDYFLFSSPISLLLFVVFLLDKLYHYTLNFKKCFEFIYN